MYLGGIGNGDGERGKMFPPSPLRGEFKRRFPVPFRRVPVGMDAMEKMNLPIWEWLGSSSIKKMIYNSLV